MRSHARLLAVTAAASLLVPAPLPAEVLVRHMNLERLARSADRVFSGTVVAIEKGEVAVGGGTLPTVTYRFSIDNGFRGTFEEKGGRQTAEVRMVDRPADRRSGRMVRFSALPPAPRMEMGQRYLLFTTAPSAAGLSTTVGLGQGFFRISGGPGHELAANEFDNVGLFRGLDGDGPSARGPVRYKALADRIKALVRR
jgi:hypothetical protein